MPFLYERHQYEKHCASGVKRPLKHEARRVEMCHPFKKVVVMFWTIISYKKYIQINNNTANASINTSDVRKRPI